MKRKPGEYSLDRLLSKKDAIGLLELIHTSLSCKDEVDYRALMQRIKDIVPYDYATTGLASIDENGIKESFEIINVDYPDEWLDMYVSKNFNLIDPIVIENFSKFTMQYWQDTYDKNPPPKTFQSVAEDFGLGKGYTYGVKNLNGTEGSLFSISGESVEKHQRTEAILQHVVPHMHLSLDRLVTKCKRKLKKPLTDRETEVLKWVAMGKSTWDISVILSISERTVNFHVSNIMEKLDAVSRTHAVAVALDSGLVDIG